MTCFVKSIFEMTVLLYALILSVTDWLEMKSLSGQWFSMFLISLLFSSDILLNKKT